MTSRDFCYWLQGVFEVAKPTLDTHQTELIRAHLMMVFVHEIDPSFPADQQGKLDAAHAGAPPAPASPLPQSRPPAGPGTLYRC